MSQSSINLKTLSAKDLQAGKFSQSLPEVYQLEQVVEKNPWHDKQDVFAHTVKVLQGFEKLQKFQDFNPPQTAWLKQYFAQKIGNCSRLEILKTVVLLHDIGKNDILIENADGTTGCPWHEVISADKVSSFSQRLGLSPKDEERAVKIVRYHGLSHETLSWLVNFQDREKSLSLFKSIVDELALDIIWLVYADLLGSDLEDTDKPAFDIRVEVLQEALSRLVDEMMKA